MSIRTDLAIELEKADLKTQENSLKIGKIEVEFTTLCENNPYNKPSGSYASVHIGNVEYLTELEETQKALLFCLERLMPKERERVLVVGLGNREIISDCIGPFTASGVLATRHIAGDFAEKIGLKGLKSVSVIAPSVLGKTGIEAAEIVLSVVGKIKPDAVIVVDALCASKPENLFSVIQLCDSGISPGSGVKNARKELSQATLGVPTVAIGVPTVVDARNLLGKTAESVQNPLNDLLLTPKDTDLLSHRISEIISTALNIFLQPDTDRELLLSLV